MAHNQSKSANTFPAYAPIPELSPLHLPHPYLTTANVNSFKTAYIFLLQTHCIKQPCQSNPRAAATSVFSTQPCCWWCRPQAPYLVLTRASILLSKLFLSEKLLALKGFFFLNNRNLLVQVMQARLMKFCMKPCIMVWLLRPLTRMNCTLRGRARCILNTFKDKPRGD